MSIKFPLKIIIKALSFKILLINNSTTTTTIRMPNQLLFRFPLYTLYASTSTYLTINIFILPFDRCRLCSFTACSTTTTSIPAWTLLKTSKMALDSFYKTLFQNILSMYQQKKVKYLNRVPYMYFHILQRYLFQSHNANIGQTNSIL